MKFQFEDEKFALSRFRNMIQKLILDFDDKQ